MEIFRTEEERFKRNQDDFKSGKLPDADHAKFAWELQCKVSDIHRVMSDFFKVPYFSKLISKAGVEETEKIITKMDAFIEKTIKFQSNVIPKE